MIHSSMNETRDVLQDITRTPVYHQHYEVREENGSCIGVNLLFFYYGELWVSAMNRLNHKIDGHLFNLKHDGATYRVYRKLQAEKPVDRPRLRLVVKK